MFYKIYSLLPKKLKYFLRNKVNNSNLTTESYNNYRKNKIVSNFGVVDLIIYANNFCNAHCGFCDVTRVDYETQTALGIGRPLVGSPVYMKTELFKKIIDDPLFQDKKISVNFLMTEPLLSKNIGEMLSLSKSKNFINKITTNGFLLEKRAEAIYDKIDHLQVSIDGPQDLHDSIRGKNFFARAIQGIKVIKNLNPKVLLEINVTITSVNYLRLFELLKYLDNIKDNNNNVEIAEVRFQFIDFVSEKMSEEQSKHFPTIPQSVSTIDDVDYLDIDIDKLYDELEKIRLYKSKNIKKITSKPKMNDKKMLQKHFDKNGPTLGLNNKCHTPYTQIAVNTSGSVYWHMRCFNNYVLGNINIKPLKEIWIDEKAKHFREQFEKSDLCFPACTRCCGLMETHAIKG